ncbi:glycosyltransferase [Christiangramia echinicola]|uniref:glycosyltransferase n=1 Tax=Christiangramia echinicola TaxID=279359 RepID=UPI000684C9AF|nr:glycosyltransferase [Christiangramia echinicola]
MMHAPQVSVIVPNYNHQKFLPKRLDSIFNQTYQNFEVILMDDASSDESVKILKNYNNHPKVSHLVINALNSGSPFHQWKKGIDLAIGEFIWIAESDDYCDYNFLEELISLTRSYNLKHENGVIYSQSYDVNEYGEIIKSRLDYTADFDPNIWSKTFKLSGKDFIDKYLKVKNVIPNASAVLFKKSLVDKSTFALNLLNMRMCGDWLFWIRLCNKTNVGFLSKPLNYFRGHDYSSRIHDTKDKKINRLIEESVIRRYLQTNKVAQKEENERLLRKWFQLQTKYDLIMGRIFKIGSGKYDYFRLLKEFLIYKLNI